ncbi:MAG TPA: acyl-ACP--UDP-N-acetylglucosamine O-acyltransferase [Candidatus Cloacimonadota bacterium]|jgi:UDP-N-acetylglucosamine acyltransferase|nr:acyl-ACP--UDP-N-acetylglucosamine O-acyltransferase [Candidatus Cloacimonadales bacterium]HPY96266.1 acyl-ACP--UDP-N-acetylglucosamine O-acyltransferase [Candidatus Cloacimonadota bacterium]HQB40855.1 acyl-ACP--UDP-N-acetylglucosamine O-acyltransferase [Candidatus Cloacimonadota bacterium]
MQNIHPTAIIHPNAKLGKNNKIGPYCTIGEHAVLGDNNELISHVVIEGHITIGDNNKFFPFCCVGIVCQDLKYNGEPTRTKIGNNNQIRECVTIHASATMDEDTVIGNNCLIMAYAHVAHNCQIGNNVIMANAVNLAGHVHVHDFVTIGGLSAAHQFVKIGTHAFIGGTSGIKKDIPPYTRGQGMDYKVVGLNSVGLMRRGFTEETIEGLKKVYRLFYRANMNVSQALEEAANIENPSPEQKIFIDFIKNSERGISLNKKEAE